MRLLENFDFSLLEDKNFKEDSVREEIIIPIFTKLGFKASGANDKFYLTRKLPKIITKPKKRATKRHFGVHGYFTKQSWDIVDLYIRNFTREGDTVLDPFGGSGVTLIESLMNSRNAIHIDLNPLCVFWMETILNASELAGIKQNADKVIKKYEKEISHIKFEELKSFFPKDVPLLSKGSDSPTLYGIFSKQQLKELAFLKKLILEVKPKAVRDSLLLAFSSAITQNNLTYHTSNPNQGNLYAGDSGAFRYYRYRIAEKPTKVSLTQSFENKVKNLLKAKEELKQIQLNPEIKFEAYKGDACDLKNIENESIDYIYTDPPYGKKIEYLDLSVMWNEWLDLKVTKEDRKKEAIEGGSLNKTKEDYSNLIIKSIQEMFRVLKWNRWMSFVFQHQDPFYWYLIVENAEKVGFEYAGVVKQNNGHPSFKKKQNPFSVLSGQLIINFKKIPNPKSIMKADLGLEVSDLILNNIESVIAEHGGATLEQIYDSLITNGLELGFLHQLSEYQDLTPYLRNNFDYNSSTTQYTLRENTQFKSQIPVEKKIKYFLLSYLRQNNRNDVYPNFDDIILDIMPLLKNGKTPEKQTIRNILEEIADHQDYQKGWKLKEIDAQNKTLF